MAIAPVFASRDVHRVVEEVVAIGLPGFLAREISLMRNRRLKCALQREAIAAHDGSSRFDKVLEELAPEALAVWADRRPVNLGRDRPQGRESTGLYASDQTASEALPKRGIVADGPKAELEEFERRETLRQELDRLKTWRSRRRNSQRASSNYTRWMCAQTSSVGARHTGS